MSKKKALKKPLRTIPLRLKKLFYNLKSPAGFSGIDALYREVNRGEKQKITRKQIATWLESQDAYTLHKTKRKRFQRNRVQVGGIDSLWQIDLADLSSLSKFNDNYKWLLVAIDVFSKYVWCQPMKNKSSKEVIRAFEGILASTTRRPKKIQSDQGTEFLNAAFQKLLKANNIGFYHTFQDVKASVVERVMRTLKGRMWKYFSFKTSYRYIDVLQDLITGYNNAKHRSIATAPSQVNKSNESIVWKQLYGDTPSRKVEFKFEVGTKVRVSKAKKIFDKGYVRNWTREIFIIEERLPRTPPVYKIKDLSGEAVEGSFYESELQRVSKEDDAAYAIEEVLGKRKRKGKYELFVKWVGYPSHFNAWIPQSSVKQLV